MEILTDSVDVKQYVKRMRSIEMRRELTDEWHRSGIHEPGDFAILTNIRASDYIRGVESGDAEALDILPGKGA